MAECLTLSSWQHILQAVGLIVIGVSTLSLSWAVSRLARTIGRSVTDTNEALSDLRRQIGDTRHTTSYTW